MSLTFINQENTDSQPGNDVLRQSGVLSDFLSPQQYARELRVRKFKKKKARFADSNNQLSNLSQSDVTSVASDKKQNPFEKFQSKIAEEYSKLAEDLKKDHIGSAQISQTKIQKYLQDYWYHKIYRKNQNSQANQGDTAGTSNQQEDSEREWKKVGSTWLSLTFAEQLVESSPEDRTTRLTSVIKGKVYLLKKAQQPQKNVEEEEERRDMARKLVRKSIFIKDASDYAYPPAST